MKKYGPQPRSSNNISKLNLSQIVIFSKPPNIIAADLSRLTVHHSKLISEMHSYQQMKTITLNTQNGLPRPLFLI